MFAGSRLEKGKDPSNWMPVGYLKGLRLLEVPTGNGRIKMAVETRRARSKKSLAGKMKQQKMLCVFHGRRVKEQIFTDLVKMER